MEVDTRTAHGPPPAEICLYVRVSYILVTLVIYFWLLECWKLLVENLKPSTVHYIQYTTYLYNSCDLNGNRSVVTTTTQRLPAVAKIYPAGG
jgi:hypothetical protein